MLWPSISEGICAMRVDENFYTGLVIAMALSIALFWWPAVRLAVR